MNIYLSSYRRQTLRTFMYTLVTHSVMRSRTAVVVVVDMLSP